MAIADKLRTQASSINQSIRNANDGIALVQIADMAMSEQSNILDIVKTKLIQAKNGTTSGEGLMAIGRDIQKLLTNLNDIANNTNYNGNTLLQAGNGDATKHDNFVFQVGELGSQTIEVKSGNMIAANTSTSGLAAGSLNGMADDSQGSLTSAGNFLVGLGSTIASLVDTGSGAAALSVKASVDGIISGKMARVDVALNDLNKMRSEFGATQNQLESAVRNLSVTAVNLKNAESGIRDVDYAQESATFNKNNIIAQAGTYAMSQANALQQNVQKLLQ
jgi:flagellin